MRKSVLFILKTTTLYATIPSSILRNLGGIKSLICKIASLFKTKVLASGIYNFENTGSKLKPDHLICCINVFNEEVEICSMINTGEKGTS